MCDEFLACLAVVCLFGAFCNGWCAEEVELDSWFLSDALARRHCHNEFAFCRTGSQDQAIDDFQALSSMGMVVHSLPRAIVLLVLVVRVIIFCRVLVQAAAALQLKLLETLMLPSMPWPPAEELVVLRSFDVAE